MNKLKKKRKIEKRQEIYTYGLNIMVKLYGKKNAVEKLSIAPKFDFLVKTENGRMMHKYSDEQNSMPVSD